MTTGTKKCNRLDKADRQAIQDGLDKRKGCREIARSIKRSPAVVTSEVKAHRTWKDGDRRGEVVGDNLEDSKCIHLAAWPWACNGCMAYRKSCGRAQRTEYVASLAQKASEEVRSSSRRGVNFREADFERIAFAVRTDILNGKSPEQIRMANPHLNLAPSTLYRWAERGYFSMSAMDFRRKVGCKPRKEHAAVKPTSHGTERSYAAFCALDEDVRDGACEMDAVTGRARDSQCPLTSHLRPCKIQIASLLPEKSSSAVVAALDSLEHILGKALFKRLFGTILTDNGAEFSDTASIEESVFDDTRCTVYYCDIRQSQQKGACERNHVELRKMLPKRRGISFDDLDGRDLAFVMSHVNPQPRPSLMGLSPLEMLKTADFEAYEAITTASGIVKVSFEQLTPTLDAVNRQRVERGLEPLT